MTSQWIGQWTGRWVGERLAVRVVDDPGNPIPLAKLVGLALRRNPRRAHLLVSTVLGKHVPTDPHLVYGAGRLLGDLVADRLSPFPPPEGQRAADLALLADAAAGNTNAARRLAARPPAPAATDNAAVVLGYAETATALGHCVAASLGWPYIHSTRRRHTGVPAVATFTEDHSHAVDHLVLAADPELLAGNGPLVLVDDELSTGRTAANTIRALHARWPRQRYVVAALTDLRAVEDRAALQQLSGDLGVPIDVVSLASGSVQLPSGLIDAATSLVNSLPMISSEGLSGTVRRHPAAWPAAVPAGGRHGVTAAQTRRLDDCARAAFSCWAPKS